jgi:hypothetical protein
MKSRVDSSKLNRARKAGRRIPKGTFFSLTVICLGGVITSVLFVVGARAHFSFIGEVDPGSLVRKDDPGRLYSTLAILVALLTIVIGLFGNSSMRTYFKFVTRRRFSLIGNKNVEKLESTPPQFGENLLYLFLPKKDKEYLIGDMAQEYFDRYSKLGKTTAKTWYYYQVVTSILHLVIKKVTEGLLLFKVRR